MDFKFDGLKDKETSFILHDLINASYGTRVPHEWYFLNLFLTEATNNLELAYLFIMFIRQYYPEYVWQSYSGFKMLDIPLLECNLYSNILEQKYMHGIEHFGVSKAMHFGDIVTDFLIRYRNYSLIKCSKQNIIITAHSDCHKRFEQYLSKGYSLERKSKVGYTGNLYTSEPFGYFYKLPVLPTRDIGYPIDEIIETSEGNYMKVLHR